MQHNAQDMIQEVIDGKDVKKEVRAAIVEDSPEEVEDKTESHREKARRFLEKRGVVE